LGELKTPYQAVLPPSSIAEENPHWKTPEQPRPPAAYRFLPERVIRIRMERKRAAHEVSGGASRKMTAYFVRGSRPLAIVTRM
jgi:hypothetical protein